MRCRTVQLATLACVAVLAAAGCGNPFDGARGSDQVVSPPPAADDGPGDQQRFPDVLDASARRGGDGSWTFEVTLSSPYDTPERYADAWRVLGPDGAVLGVRELRHDHAGEQPFTRSLSGVEVPDGVATVTIEGRDLANGWGGGTVDVRLLP